MFSRYKYDTSEIHVRYDVSRLCIHTGRYLRPRGKLEPMESRLCRQTPPPTMPEVCHEEDHMALRHPNHPPIPRPYLKCSKSGPDGRAWVPWCAMQVFYLAGGIVGVATLRWRAHAAVLNAVAPLMFVSSMYRSLITIQYPKCIQRVSKWYRKTIQYRSPDGAKNVSCSYRASIEQKVSRYCIESRIDEITIHVRYTTIHYNTLRYIYGENPPRYMGKKAPLPTKTEDG